MLEAVSALVCCLQNPVLLKSHFLTHDLKNQVEEATAAAKAAVRIVSYGEPRFVMKAHQYDQPLSSKRRSARISSPGEMQEPIRRMSAAETDKSAGG